jgi:hypothetical protein
LIRFAGEEVVLEIRDDEVIVFKSFFRAGLWFPLYEMIRDVLKKFEIYLHQLTHYSQAFAMLKDFAGSMNSITRLKREQMVCTSTLDVTILHAERIRRPL